MPVRDSGRRVACGAPSTSSGPGTRVAVRPCARSSRASVTASRRAAPPGSLLVYAYTSSSSSQVSRQQTRPPAQHLLVVRPDVLAPAGVQAQVAPPGRAPERRDGLRAAVGPHQRSPACRQHVAQVGVPPARVPRLDGDAGAGREAGQAGVEPLHLALQVRRQLQQHDAEPVAQSGDALKEPGDGLLGLPQPLDVRQEAGRLHRDDVVGGRTGAPLLEDLAGRQPVEAVVHLDRGEGGGVVLEPEPLGQPGRVEAAAPVAVLPAGGADVDGHPRGLPRDEWLTAAGHRHHVPGAACSPCRRVRRRAHPTRVWADGSYAFRALLRTGSVSRPDRPFHARLTRWAATSSRPGVAASSHHWPTSATCPTSAWE